MDWKNVPDQAKLRTERARRIWKAPGASTGVNCLRLTHNGTALSMGLSDGSVAVLLLEAIRAPPGKQATCTAAAAAPVAPSSPPPTSALLPALDDTAAPPQRPQKQRKPPHAGCISALASQGNARSPTFTSSVDGSIRQWTTTITTATTPDCNKTTASAASTLVGRHKGPINGLDFSKDRRYLFSTSTDGTLMRWDLGNKAVRQNGGVPPGRVLTRFGRGALTVCVDAGGRGNVFVGVEGGAVAVVDAASGVILRHFNGHTDSILGMDKNTAHRTLVTGSRDGTCRTWFAGRCQSVYVAHGCPVYAVRLVQSATACVSAGADGIIHGWDAHASVPRIVYHGGHEGLPVFALALDPGSGCLYSAGSNGVVKVWEPTTPCEFCQEKCASLSKSGRCPFCGPVRVKRVTMQKKKVEAEPEAEVAAASLLTEKQPIPSAVTMQSVKLNAPVQQRKGDGVLEELPMVRLAEQLADVTVLSAIDSSLPEVVVSGAAAAMREEEEEEEEPAMMMAKVASLARPACQPQEDHPSTEDREGGSILSPGKSLAPLPATVTLPAVAGAAGAESRSSSDNNNVQPATRRKQPEATSAYPTLEPGKLTRATMNRRKRLEAKKKRIKGIKR